MLEKFLKMKQNNEKIVMVTCYDATMAKIMSNSNVDMFLVGDSVGMTKLGYENTLSVTMDDMIHHTKATARGTNKDKVVVVADMPYKSYEDNPKLAAENAKKLIDAGADMVKLEVVSRRPKGFKENEDEEELDGNPGGGPCRGGLGGGYFRRRARVVPRYERGHGAVRVRIRHDQVLGRGRERQHPQDRSGGPDVCHRAGFGGVVVCGRHGLYDLGAERSWSHDDLGGILHQSQWA